MQRSWRRTWGRCKPKYFNRPAATSQLVAHPIKILAKNLVPAIAVASLLLATMTSVYANPTGGTVTTGTGTIDGNSNTMTITQSSTKLGINWQTFSIAAGETVKFIQPNAGAIALNRVVGNDASSIYGNLSANGKVFLVNPNGVLFAPGSQVDVGGLVASTLNISDRDFQAGNYKFSGDGGSVVNQGTIKAANGGYVALLGGRVSNQGVIVAQQGTVALGAGKAATLDFAGDGLLSLAVNEAALEALAENTKLIQADGGKVVMAAGTADTLAGTVINNSGTIRAQSISNVNGVIHLDGGTNGTIENNGTLDATGAITVEGDNIHITRKANINTTGDLVLRAGTAGTGDRSKTVTIDPGAKVSGKDVSIYYNPANYADTKTKSDTDGNPYAGKVSGQLTAYMLVNNVNDLQKMERNRKGIYALNSDIEAGDTANWNKGEGFEPVGSWDFPFTGVFDGDGHVIKNLTINYPYLFESVGLFGTAKNATIRNVGLVNVNISGGHSAYNSYIGGLVGINYGNSTITNCYTTGKVSGNTSEYDDTNITEIIGGLVGMNYGTISKSYSTAEVTGGYDSSALGGPDVGGLVGKNYSGLITECYSTGSVTGIGGVSFAGGLVGYNQADIINSYSTGAVNVSGFGPYAGGLVGSNGINNTIANCYSTGAVNATGDYGYVGGLVGSSYGYINNSFWDIDTSRQATGAGYDFRSNKITGLSAKGNSPYADSSYSGFDFAKTWYMINGATRPFLRSEYSTTIANAHQLQLMALNLGASYTLRKNIDMSELTNPAGLWNTATGFVSVGSGKTPFTGRLNGHGYTIGGLTINAPTANDIGLFGHTENAAIENVGLTNVNITGNKNVGGLVGYNVGGTISNSYSTGTVIGYYTLGGLVGNNNAGRITNSYSDSRVSGIAGSVNNDYLGGLVGYNYDGNITNSYSTGNVTGSASSYGVGGLVGVNSNDGSTAISMSYSTGKVSGTAYVGGLVGISYNSTTNTVISNSYSTGAVTGTAYGGGLVGYNNNLNYGKTANSNLKDISDCYSTGAVSVKNYGGGLVGVNYGNVLASFWDKQTSGKSMGVGYGNSSGIGGLTTAQMGQRSSFTGWNFDTIWGLVPGRSFPSLIY